jgi:hypothetical protein
MIFKNISPCGLRIVTIIFSTVVAAVGVYDQKTPEVSKVIYYGSIFSAEISIKIKMLMQCARKF